MVPLGVTLVPEGVSAEACCAHAQTKDKGLMHWVFMCPLLFSDAASGVSLLFPPQIITAPIICHCCPVLEQLGMSSGSHMHSWCVSGDDLWCSDCCSEIWETSEVPLYKHQQWSPLPHPGSALGPGCLCDPQSSLFYGHGCPRFSATQWCRVSGSRAFALHGLGCTVRQLWEVQQPLRQTSLYPALGVSQCMQSSRVESRFPPALLFVSVVL